MGSKILKGVDPKDFEFGSCMQKILEISDHLMVSND